jgi:DUF971 family protein
MTNPRITPKEIAPTSDGTALRIAWKDGHVSVYSPHALRLLCPCAGCIDEMSGRPILDPSTVPAGVYPTAIHYVGRYALQFMWSDGHSTGFYPFEMLRKACDGDECASEAAGG